MNSELITTLSERGFINQSTNLQGLDDLAQNSKIVSYVGFDLTANSLHVGSLIQIMVLRWMLKLGHKPIVLFGEATTRIGDPSGKTEMRKMLTDEQIELNRVGITRVIDRLVGGLQPYSSSPMHVSNAEWFSSSGPSYMDFLADYGRHFTINKMLTFDSVKTRLARQEPLTFLEFNYMMMQAVDFLKLNNKYDCVLQVGGSDQWGNIVNGVDLIRRLNKAEVFGLTTPLMTNSAGEKMGKTASGAIWLDPDKTSAFEFWQFWRNVEDSKVGDFLRLFTELSMDDITRIEVLEGSEINLGKKILATEVTALVHGRATAEECAKMLSETNRIEKSNAIPEFVISAEDFERGTTLAQILFDAGLVSSKTEAAKIAANRGIKVNEKIVEDVRAVLTNEQKNGFRVSVGKNKIVSIRIGN